MQDPASLASMVGGLGGGPGQSSDGPGIGLCFQLALLAAAQNNDQEAGDYLRQLIAAMKGRTRKEGSDAGEGAHS